MQRTQSESGSSLGGPSTKRWRKALNRIGSKGSVKDPKSWSSRPRAPSEQDLPDTLTLRHTDSNSFNENDSNCRQLYSLVQRMRSAPSGANHIDQAYNEFMKIKERAATLCLSILQDEIKPLRISPSATDTTVTREESIYSPRSPGPLDNRSSFSGRSLAEAATSGTGRTAVGVSEIWLGPIRDWKTCLENLSDAFRTSLAETYKSYERDATPEMLDALFSSKKFRREAVHRMRNASVTRVLSADPQFFPRYEIRFRNYEKVKLELNDIRQILQSGESGISPFRSVMEFAVSPRGDAVLEFANLSPGCSPNDPVLRFRVSSYMLAEASPIFARMFSGPSKSMYLHETEDIFDQLPPPPTKYFCKDGTETWLYRMPQREINKFDSTEILMHAAHLHNEKVPRTVTFEQFVAISECSLRLMCTSPLEVVVEHRWLPQWMHRGADEMPDGLLIISYAFGSRGLFTRMSKSAVLNLVDEKDLQSKPWPQRIKNKIWAVRTTKMDQLYACCRETIQEYLRPPTAEPTVLVDTEEPPPTIWGSLATTTPAPPPPTLALSSATRCPKGSHWCDATNLGWLMMAFNNMNILGQTLHSAAVPGSSETTLPPKSLAQLVEMLRSVPHPVAPVHRGGVCDPIATFRRAVGDIYNSVTGLTLYDIGGKSHGWALSKHAMSIPQSDSLVGLGRMAAPDESHTVVNEFPESVLLLILSEITDLEDLQAAARVNRAFYVTYKTYELRLMQNILRVGRIRSGVLNRPIPLSASNAEGKLRKSEADLLKDHIRDDRTDAVTVDANDGHDTDSSDEESSGDEMPTRTTVQEYSQPPLYPAPPNASRDARRPDPQREASNSSDANGHSLPRLQTDSSSSREESNSPARRSSEAPPMTVEEANRILWPDDADDESPRTPRALAHRGAGEIPLETQGTQHEKLLLRDKSMAAAPEDKTLVHVKERRLLTENNRRTNVAGGSRESGGGE